MFYYYRNDNNYNSTFAGLTATPLHQWYCNSFVCLLYHYYGCRWCTNWSGPFCLARRARRPSTINELTLCFAAFIRNEIKSKLNDGIRGLINLATILEISNEKVFSIAARSFRSYRTLSKWKSCEAFLSISSLELTNSFRVFTFRPVVMTYCGRQTGIQTEKKTFFSRLWLRQIITNGN